MLHSWGQCGGCFVWLNQSIKRSCRLIFWWYSSVNASESLAANPDRKLVGRKKHSKCLTPIQTRKVNQAAITFFFFPGRAVFFTSSEQKPFVPCNMANFPWDHWGCSTLPFPAGLCSKEMAPLWCGSCGFRSILLEEDALPQVRGLSGLQHCNALYVFWWGFTSSK